MAATPNALRTTLHRALPVAAAALLVFSAIAIVADAQSSCSGDRITIPVGPSTVGPSQQNSQRTILVTNVGACPVDKIIFSIADLTSPARELKFRAEDSVPVTTPAGWTMSAANSGTTNFLTYTSVGGHQIASQSAENFIVSVDASGAPTDGVTFTMTAVGYYLGTATHSLQTPHTIRVDGTPPLASTATLLDIGTPDQPGPNGHLDAFRLVFNEDLQCKSIVPSDFKANLATDPVAYQTKSFTPNPRCNTLTFSFQEDLVYDTGKLPNIGYTPGDATDLAGNKLASIPANLVEVDGAAPVLVSAAAKAGDSTILVTFSEAVHHDPGTSATVLTGVDFEYLPGSCSATVCKINTVTHASGADAHRALLSITPALQASDVDPNTGFQVCAFKTSAGQATIVDNAPVFNRLVKTSSSLCPHVTGPQLVTAEVNIDSNSLLMTFNGPMTGQGSSGEIRLQDIDIINTEISGGGPTGITSLLHKGTGNMVRATLDATVRPTDVDNTPSRVRILTQTIGSTGTSITMPATDTELIDKTDPSIRYANTTDTDGDGLVDAYFLTFSERIDDASFQPAVFGIPPTLGNGHTVSATLDTGDVDNDNKAIIHFSETPTDHTGVKPEFRTSVDGLFQDFANIGKGAPNELRALPTDDSLAEIDRANPVVMAASTVDSGAGDGRLDGYLITMSEPVKDATFIARATIGGQVRDAWTVEFRAGLGFTTGSKADDNTFVLTFGQTSSYDTDAKPQVQYTQLFKSDGTPFGGIQDLAGNFLLSFGAGGINEVDNAAPVLVEAVGFAGKSLLDITFSEPVDDGAGGPITRSDLFYSNINAPPLVSGNPPCSEGTSGFISTREIDHQPGSRTARATLNCPLHPSDIGKDAVRAEVAAIVELAAPHQSVVPKNVVIGEARDLTPPGNITDLKAVGPVTANSVTLQWIAPGDDYQGGDNVVGYRIRQSEFPITATNFDGGQVEDVTIDAYLPPVLVAPGEVQAVLILNLTPKTVYHFALAAFDNGSPSNLGNVSADIQVETIEDQSRPPGTLVIQSTTHPQNQARANQNPRFTWNSLTDPESTVIYRWAMNHQSGYEVKSTDNTTGTTTSKDFTTDVQPGSWYFHVAGFSGGGKTVETAHYRFIVDYEVVLADSIRLANKGFNITVQRQDSDNTIYWNLPAKEGLPGVFQGVTIWRLEDGEWVPLKVLDGDYSDLAVANYTDDTGQDKASTRYLVTITYKDDQGGAEGSKALNPEYGTEPNQYEGVRAPAEKKGVDTWVWILIGIVGALLIAGLIVFFVLRSRSEKDALAREAAAGGYQWEEEGPPSAVDPATGLPIHDVKCPSCSHQFQATGNMPLDIACPSCGVTGTLAA
ncbi:MAG TPA: hypothetical protein VI796_01435 [Candidatus Thermoplasmatota archaeon]|nr:hypothetical protein [Candidatus Thermoplasmatota archaeon]